MTKPPNENEELSPLVEGLQQLKYDENENTPDGELEITENQLEHISILVVVFRTSHYIQK